MPVGRFVLDVHGESRATWPANDALCAALQIINHLQDCGRIIRDLDRVYVPLDALAAAGASVEDARRATRASPALRALPARARRAHRHAARRERGVLRRRSRTSRLALEVAVIQSLARRLVALLHDARPAERARASRQGRGRRRRPRSASSTGMAGRFGRAVAASPASPQCDE